VYFHTTNRFIIALAFGPRRATSNTRYGKLDSAYPKDVGADHKLWLLWIKDALKRWVALDYYVVIPTKRAKDKSVVSSVRSSEESNPTVGPTLSEEKVQRLLSERQALRDEKSFEEADKIRDYLLEHGVEVRDAKRTGITRTS